MMKARIRIANSGVVKAECGNCGRFLSEIHGTTNTIAKCSSCKRDNTISVCYANNNGNGRAQ